MSNQRAYRENLMCCLPRFKFYNFVLKIVRKICDLHTHIGDIYKMARERQHLIYRQRAGGLVQQKPYKRAVVVALYPNENNLPFSLNLLRGLEQAGFFVLCVATGRLNPAIGDPLLAHCHYMIEKFQIGRDIGSYQMGIEWIQQNKELQDIDTLGIVNDSLFYPAAIGETIKDMLDQPGDWLALFENFEIHYHVQSFFEIFRAPVFKSQPFKEFWRDYKPFSSRTHAIHQGESGLTCTLLKAGFLPVIYYNSQKIKQDLITRLTDPQQRTISFSSVLGLTLKKDYWNLYCGLGHCPTQTPVPLHEIASAIASLAERKNPTHALGLLCNNMFKAPLKCDICSGGSNSIADVVTLAQGFTPEEIMSMKRYLHKRGLPASRARWSWTALKADAGVI